MNRLLSLFSLLLLLAAAAAAGAAGDPADRELYSASTKGELTIDATGRVVEVRIEPRNLGAAAIASYEQRARGWTFEPVLENGRPVAAKAHFSLDLLAVRERGVDGGQLGVQALRFYEPSDAPAETEDVKARLASIRANPPRYPSRALQAGVEAKVFVLADIGPDGRVVAQAADEVSVMHPNIRDADLESWGASFAKAAEKAIARWRFPGHEGTVVRVPMQFTAVGSDLTRWRRTWPVPVERPAWVLDASTRSRMVALDANGERPSDRVRMRSAVDG